MKVFDVNDLNKEIQKSLLKEGFEYSEICEIDAFRRHILWYSSCICLIRVKFYVAVLEVNTDSEYFLEAGCFKYHLYNPNQNNYYKKVLQVYCNDDADLIRLINGNSKGMHLTCKVPSRFICTIYRSTAATPAEELESYDLDSYDVIGAIRETVQIFQEFLS